MENLHIPITGDASSFHSALQNARNGVRQTARQIEESGMSIEQMFNRIRNAAAMSLAGFSVKEFASKVMQVRGEFQQLEVAFNTMLGSAEKANALMQQLTRTAAITPFDLKGVTDGAKQLLAYGIAAEEVNDTLVHLGDIAAGLSLPLGDLVYLYGTTMTQGRMFTQDLRQFMGRGIPLAEELAKQFGVTKDKVGELVTAGKVGAEEFKKAIMSMSSEGGKFGGLMEEQSKTISGQISNIEDAVDMMFNNLGKQSEGIISGTLDVVSSLVENYETVGRVVAGLIATYGVYKTAVLVVTALESFRTKNLALEAVGLQGVTAAEAIHFHWLNLTQKAQALLNATMLANPYVAVAVAIAAVTVAFIALGSEQSRVNAAYDEYMRKKDEAIAKEEEHKRKIDELIQTADDEGLSTDTRREALFKLEEKYPDIFKKYATEIEMLKHIRDIKEEIAILDGQASLSNPVNELAEVDKQIAELQKKGAWSLASTNSYAGTHGSSRTRKEEEELQGLLRRRRELAKEIEKDRGETYLTNLTGVSNGSLQAQINERRNLLAKIRLQEQEGKKVAGKVNLGGATGIYSKEEIQAQLQALEREQNRRTEIIANGSKDFVAEANKAYTKEKTALQQLEALHDPQKRASSTLEIDGVKVNQMNSDQFLAAVEKQQKAVDEAKKKVDAYNKAKNGGSKSDKTASEAAARNAKQLQDQWKHEEEMADLQEKAARAREDASVAAINNQVERERKEREIQHKREIEDLKSKEEEIYKVIYQQRKQAYETANKDKKYENTETGEVGYLSDDARAAIEKSLSEEERKQFDANQAYFDAKEQEANAKYARYVEERVKQEEKANHEAINTYLRQYGDYAQKKQAIYDEANDKICELQEQLGKATTDEAKAAVEAQIDTVRKGTKTQIDELDVQYGKAKAFMIDLFEDAGKKSVGEIDKIIKKYEALVTFLKGDMTGDARQQLIKDFGFTDKEIDQAISKLNTEGVESIKSFTDRLKGLKDELANRSEWQAIKQMINEAGDATTSDGRKIELMADSATRATTIIGDLGSSLLNAFNIDDSQLKSAVQTLKDFAAIGKGIGQIKTGDVLSGVTTIAGAAISVAGSIFSAISGNREAERAREQARTNRLLETANDRIQDLNETLSKSYGVEAERLAELTREEIRNKQNIALSGLRSSTGHLNNSADGATLGKLASQLAAEYGLDIGGRSATGDWTDWWKIWRDLLNNNSMDDIVEFLKGTKDIFEGVTWVDDSFLEYINTLIEAEEELVDTNNNLREQILGTSFDSVYGDFLNSLYDLADGSEDVFDSMAENWEKMVNRMVINNALAENLKRDLQAWYDQWYADYEEHGFDEQDRTNRRNAYNEILKKYAQQIENMKQDGLLIPLPGDEETKQYFTELKSMFLSTLTDMNASAEDWSKEIGKIMAKDIISQRLLGSTFTTWLEKWQEKYSNVMSVQDPGEQKYRLDLLRKELEEMREKLSEEAKTLFDTLGLSNFLKDNQSALSDLKSQYVSFFADTTSSAEEWMQNLRKNLLTSLLEKGLLEKGPFGKALEEWSKGVEDIMSADIPVAEMAHHIEQMMPALEQILGNGQKWADAIIKEFNIIGNATPFSGLRDTFLDTLTDMEGDAESFKQKLQQTMVRDLIEKQVLDVPLTVNGLSFDNFDAYVTDWNKRYAAAVKSGNQEAIDALINELVSVRENTVKAAEELRERLKKVEQETTFTGMEGNFVSALMDMETNVEDFANDIKRTIVQKLVEAFMVSEQIKPLLNDLQATFNAVMADESLTNEERAQRLAKGFTAADGTVYAGIDGLAEKLTPVQAAVQSLLTAIGYKAKEAETAFSDLGTTILDSLMNTESGVEDFMAGITETIARELAGAFTSTEEFQQRLATVKKQLEEAVESGDTAKIEAAKQAVRDLYEEAEQGAKDYRKMLEELHQDTTFRDMTSSWVSSLMDFNATAEDWAKEIGRTMAQRIIEQMIVPTLMQPLLTNLQTAVNGAFGAQPEGGTDWQAVIGDDKVQEALTAINQAYPQLKDTVGKILAALNVTPEAKQGFSDLRGAFTATLLDMEGDAQTFAKSIGQTMMQQMLDAYIDTRYSEEMATLNQQWAEALEAGNTQALDAIQQKVLELYRTISGDAEVGRLSDAIKQLDTQLDTTFSDMGSSWTSTLMDMEATAEDWAESVGRTIAEKIINATLVPTMIQPLLNQMQEAWNEAAAQEGATYQTMLAAMSPYLTLLTDAYAELRPMADYILNSLGVFKDAVEEVAEEVEYHLQDMKSNFASTLMDMEGDAEEWSQSISRTLAEAFIKDFVLGDAFDRQMEDWQKHYESILNGDLSEDERQRQLQLLRNTIVAAKDGYVEQAMAIQELLGLNTTAAADAQTATTNMADKITYEQADQLLGVNMAQEMTLEQILATLRGGSAPATAGTYLPATTGATAYNADETASRIEQTLRNISGLSQPDGDTLREMRGLMLIGNSYLFDIKESNAKILQQFGALLGSIDSKLSRF